LTLFVALAAGLLACWTSVAAADETIAQAVIYKQGEQAPTAVGPVSLSTLEQTPACTPYSNPGARFDLVGPQGDSAFAITSETWTLYMILECGLGQTLPPGSTDWVEVENPNTGKIEAPLSMSVTGGLSDLVTPSDFADSTQVPLVTVDQNDGPFAYYRPQRQTPAGSPADQNAGDYFASTEPITIDVSEGGSPPLSVSLAETPSTVSAGQTMTLSAAVSGAPNAADLSYGWSSSGGATFTSTTGPSVQATFPAGTYTVTVDATDNVDGTFGAQTANITVGAAGPDSTSGTPNSANGQTQQPSAPATGPKLGSGSAVGGSAGTAHHPSPSGKSGGKGATDVKKPKPTPKSIATHPSTTPVTSGPPSAASGPPASSSSRATLSVGDARSGHTAHRPRANPPAAHAKSPLSTPSIRTTTDASLPRVTGRLIGGVSLLPAGASPLVHVVAATPPTAAAVRRGVSASVLPALAGALVVILLFSLGIGRELRWRRGWGARLFGS
jgi:hypothetical protein